MRRTPLRRTRGFRTRDAAQLAQLMAAQDEVYARQDGCCQRCGDHMWRRSYACTFHHVLPHRKGGADTADNLVLLCVWCHDWVETHPAQARKDGWLV